jgi:hypothetical protein
MAAEARQTAKTVSAQDVKDALEKIAQGYDQRADDLERKRPIAWWKRQAAPRHASLRAR